jgi:hypothetical protein
MANMAASLGAQMPCSVINPVTKRWGYVKDVSNSFTIECCNIICRMCSHNPILNLSIGYVYAVLVPWPRSLLPR